MSSQFKNLAITITFLGSLLTIPIFFMINKSRSEYSSDPNYYIKEGVLNRVLSYSIACTVLVCLLYIIYYFIEKESNLFKILSLMLSISSLVISCIGISAALDMKSEEGKTYSYNYSNTQLISLVCFISVLIFSCIMIVSSLLVIEEIYKTSKSKKFGK